MRPEDVWIIFNKISMEMLFIFATRDMADAKLDRLIEDDPLAAPKLMSVTLQRALAEINIRHVADFYE